MLHTLLQEYAVQQHETNQKMLHLVESYTLGMIVLLEDMSTFNNPPTSTSKQLWSPKFADNTYGWLTQQNELPALIDKMAKIRQAIKIVHSLKPGPVRGKHISRIFTALNKIRGHISELIKLQQSKQPALSQDEEICDFDKFMDMYFPDCEKYQINDQDAEVDLDDSLWDEQELSKSDNIDDVSIDNNDDNNDISSNPKSFLDYLSNNS